ncbi:MAG: hypothetical protein V1743_02310 [Nanoarchaeota archaeon]
MKCDICGKKIEETFLKKPIGTFVKDKKHKKKLVCPHCQKTLSAEEIRAKL